MKKLVLAGIAFILSLILGSTPAWAESLRVSATFGNQSLQLTLAVDLTQNQVVVSPLPKNSFEHGLTIAGLSGTVFEGKVDWVSVGGIQYFAPDKPEPDSKVSTKTQVFSPSVSQAGATPSAILGDTALGISVGTVGKVDPSVGSGISEPLFNIPSVQLSFDSMRGKTLFAYATDKSGQHQLVSVVINDFTYWINTLKYWNITNPSVTQTQVIKNTLLRSILTDDARQFFSAPFDVARYDAMTTATQLPTTRKEFLDDFARLTFSQLGVTNKGSYETARLPASSFYEPKVSSDSSVVHEYFRILQSKQQADSRAISEQVRSQLVTGVLAFLFGPESTLNEVKTADDKSNKIVSLNNLYHTLNPAEFSNQTLVSAFSASRAAELTLLRPDAQTPVDFSAGDNELLFLPPSENLFTSNAIQNPGQLNNLFWETAGVQEAAFTQLAFTFNETQKAYHWAFWANASFQVAEVNGIAPTASSRLKTSTDTRGRTTLEKTGVKAGGYQLYLVSVTPGNTRNWTFKFASGTKILKVAAYDTPPNLNYSWVRTRNIFDISAYTGVRFSDIQPILALPQRSLSFLSVDYEPSSGPTGNRFSPVRYSYGGWETPQSYNIKVIDNHLAKEESKRRFKFPFTELDGLKTLRPITEKGLYESAPALSDFRFPYGDIQTRRAYVYGYGLNLPYSFEALLSSQSPFFLEKTAGVDSLGLLTSLLIKNGIVPTYDVQANLLAERWAARTGLLAFSDFFPYTRSTTEASTLGKLTQSTVRWFERNSNVLLDWGQVRAGDILVGNVGSSVEVAIVLWVPSGVSTFESFRAQVRVATVNKATQAAVLTTWKDLVNESSYHARRLVSSPNQDTTVFAPQEVTIPQGMTTMVPASGEMAAFTTMSMQTGVNGTNASFQVRPAVDSVTKEFPAWTLPEGSVVDYDYDASQVGPNDFNNKLDNPTEFYLVAYSWPDYQDRLRGEIPYLLSPPVTLAIDPTILSSKEKYREAVVLAKFTPQPGTAAMKIDWQYDSDKYALVTNRVGSGEYTLAVNAPEIAGGTGRKLFEWFGVFARTANGPAHVGDDIQLNFYVNSSLVYKTMPVVVTSFDPDDYWELYTDATASLAAFDLAVEQDSSLTPSQKRTSHFYTEWMRGLNDKNTLYNPLLEDERIIGTIIRHQEENGLDPDQAVPLLDRLNSYFETGDMTGLHPKLLANLSFSQMSGTDWATSMTGGGRPIFKAVKATSKKSLMATASNQKNLKRQSDSEVKAYSRALLAKASNFLAMVRDEQLALIDEIRSMSFKDYGWQYLKGRAKLEDIFAQTIYKHLVQTKSLSLGQYNPEFFRALDLLSRNYHLEDFVVNGTKRGETIVCDEMVSIKTTTVPDPRKILTKRMINHIRDLNSLARGDTLEAIGSWHVRSSTGAVKLDIRVPRSVLDQTDMKDSNGLPTTYTEEIVRVLREAGLDNDVEIVVGAMEDAVQ